MFFYSARSNMSGVLQGFFFFGYMLMVPHSRERMIAALQPCQPLSYLCVCTPSLMSMLPLSYQISYAFILMLGSVGFWVALKFVRYIYGSIKVD